MLVKKSIVERWYQTDSWVYKNFAYLFQNPLWNKRVPQGFSVCPYFWLNLFSLLIFRPFFVAPIKYIFIPFIKLLGKPAEAVDRGLYNVLQKIGIGPDSYHPAAGIMVSLLTLIATTAILGLLAIFGHWVYNFYPNFTSTSLGMFTFWSIASFIGLWVGLFIHKIVTDTECKTYAYLYVWAALFVLGMFIFIPSELFAGVSVVIGAIGEFFAMCGSGIWASLKFVGHWGWVGISLLFTWTPVDALYVPWWAYLVGATLLMWGLAAVLDRIELSQFNEHRTETTEEFWERNKDSWISLFTRTIVSNDFWLNGELFSNNDYDGYFDTRYENKACHAYRHMLYRKAVELLLADKLDELKKMYPLVRKDEWAKYIKDHEGDLTDRVNSLASILDSSVVLPQINFASGDFHAAIRKARNLPEIKKSIDDLAAEYEKTATEKRERVIAKKTSAAAILCKRTTAAISEAAKSVGRGIGWMCAQVGTFAVYMWMLAKAKKQGACPYFRFTDPTEKK